MRCGAVSSFNEVVVSRRRVEAVFPERPAVGLGGCRSLLAGLRRVQARREAIIKKLLAGVVRRAGFAAFILCAATPKITT